MGDLYERDYYAWANEQAALLRAGLLGQADIENIAEEIESLGKSERRELVSRLRVILIHLLKWQFQPSHRGPSWEATIQVQRNDLAQHLSENPSLRSQLPECVRQAYRGGRIEAAGETSLNKAVFPLDCPWSFAQIMDEAFWPDGG